MLDNEAPDLHKDSIENAGSKYQIVPPNNYISNASELKIRTFKEHFLLILEGLDVKISMSIWDHPIEQEIVTINLLLQSKIHPHLSA